MKRIVLNLMMVLVMITVLVGCSGETEEQKESFSQEEKVTPQENGKQESKLSDEKKKEEDSSQTKTNNDMVQYLGKTKADVVAALGEPDIFGFAEGWRMVYDDLKVFFCLSDEEGTVLSIRFRGEVFGVKEGMTYDEVKAILGNPEGEEVSGQDGTTYLMFYSINNYGLTCELTSKDGDVYSMEVYKKENNEEQAEEIVVGQSILEEDELSKHIKYVDDNIKNFSSEEVDESLDKIVELQYEFLRKYEQIMFENINESILSNVEYDKSEIDNIEAEKERKLITDIFNRGYKLESGEGELYLNIDDTYLTKYDKYISDERKDYQQILVNESEYPTAMDACIMISWDELANRALKCEEFLAKYQNSSKRDEIANKYEGYIYTYLSGLDNSPIIDYETKKISEEVLNSYKKTVAENEGTKTEKIVKAYLKAIEEKGFKITGAVAEGLTERILDEINNETKETKTVVSDESNSFKIESIHLNNLVNKIGRYDYEEPVNKEYDGERTVFYGETMIIETKYSEDIDVENNDIESLVKNANTHIDSSIDMYISMLESNLLRVVLNMPTGKTDESEIDITIPKGIASKSGNMLNKDKVIKLKCVPHVVVKPVSHIEDSQLSGDDIYKAYTTVIPKKSDYEFSLIFSAKVNKESVMEKVKEGFSEFDCEYDWINDKELKISIKNIEDDITAEIDLSSSLDEKGNRIYTTLLIIIEVAS